MKIFPKCSFQVDSALSADEVYAALSAATEIPRWFQLNPLPGMKFYGEVGRDSFKIWPIIAYRNSFLPIIVGNITPVDPGTHLSITMRLHRFVAGFLVVWLSGTCTGSLALLGSILNGKASPWAVLAPLGMLAFATALTSFFFWHEAKKSKGLLLELLQGTEQ